MIRKQLLWLGGSFRGDYCGASRMHLCKFRPHAFSNLVACLTEICFSRNLGFSFSEQPNGK